MAVEGRRGLGRGLQALLGENEVAQTLSAEPSRAVALAGVQEVPIELLRRNPDQPRKVFDEGDLEELAASIREKGVIQPLLVRPAPDGNHEYEIVAGERRWRAAQRAGLRDLPVVVRNLADGEVLELGIIENVQRVDLNAIEEALAYKALMERFGRTQDAVAEAVGKSRPHIANALRLLTLPEAVQGYVLQGQLSAGHARAIVTASDPVALARQVIDRNLSVRATEAMARSTAEAEGRKPKGGAAPGAARGKDADTVALENDLSEALGLQVQILDRDGAGEVRVAYATLEQLDELCRRLSRH
jgi:ParB family chromosome partitioning protein